MSIKELIIGGAVTVVIGGTAYTVTEADIATNFAGDTGLSQQEAEEYVSSVKDEDLVSFEEVGASYISGGQETLSIANELDCQNYDYEWQTATLTCDQGKAQLIKTGNDEIQLGESYKILNEETANEGDMNSTMALLDTVNVDYDYEIMTILVEPADLSEMKKSNSYNKALLKSAIESK